MFSRLISVLLLVGMSVACCTRPEPVTDSEAPSEGLLSDSQLVAIDHGAPFTTFDGSASSILLLDGWLSPEKMRLSRKRQIHFAWISGTRACARFEGPPAQKLDFVADCLPFRYDGAPPQELRVRINGRAVQTAELRPSWQLLRIQIPADAVNPGSNEICLELARSTVPSEVTEGSKDDRSLSAAFASLAILPRHVESLDELLNAVIIDPGNGRLTLANGTAVTVPLPANTRVHLRLGSVKSTCESCTLELALVPWSGRPTSIWSGDAQSASRRVFDFSTLDQLSRLRIALEDRAHGLFDSEEVVRVEIPGDFLHLDPLSDGPVQPHVFVYLVDTLRADSLSPYGSQRPSSADIDAFARDGVIYQNAWSPSSWTLPAVVSVLTGVYPFRHGIMKGDVKFSENNAPALATLLTRAGYDSLGISHSFVASDRFGVTVGFQQFHLFDHLSKNELRSQEVRKTLLSALLQRQDPIRPIFAYLHTVDPHAPYTLTPEGRGYTEQSPGALDPSKYSPKTFTVEGLGSNPAEVEHLKALYDGEVAVTERQFGRFLNMLKLLDLYDDSVIVLLSDHGEEFNEHGGFDHGRTLYEEQLRVPLIVKYPGSKWAGTRILQRVSTLDLAPTILALAEVETDNLILDGRSLLPSELTDSQPERALFAEVNPAPAEHLSSVNYRAIVQGNLKCIENLAGNDQFGRPVPRWQVYDLGSDPGEANALDDDSEGSRRCQDLLAEWYAAELARGTVGQGTLIRTDEDALKELRALGYIE
jgi:arylsulfatase A-like enzyme